MKLEEEETNKLNRKNVSSHVKFTKGNLLMGCLTVSLLLTVAVAPLAAQGTTTVYVDPETSVVPDVGESFTVNVAIADVTNLYGYQFKLYYDTNLLDCVDVILPSGHFLTPANPTKIFFYKDILDNYNATHGRVSFVAIIMPPETPKSGSGVLVSINFSSTGLNGPSPFSLVDTRLSDPDAEPIPHETVDGYVTVIPEFSSTAIATVLIIITSVTITLGKIARSKKRKGTLPDK